MRLFVALEVPEAVRREVARRMAGLRERLPRARWVDPEILHLTLLFLGPVEEAKVPALAAALRAAFAPHPPAALRLAGGGTFPPRRPARVAWIGMEAPADLEALQADATAAAVAAIGFAPEKRPFHPHVPLPGEIGPPWVADHGVLFESKLSPRGARYREVERLPLSGLPGDTAP